MFLRKTLFFILAVSMSAGIPAEEEVKKTSLLSRIKQNESSGEFQSEDEKHCFLIIKGDNGSGSGFIATLFEQPVIVTNAHIFLELENPVVVDINNNRYKITEVLASRSRDLVILGFEPPKNVSVTPLTIIGSADSVPDQTKVTAYGNNRGGVIAAHDGKLKAIGPEQIELELDSGITTDSSGGPVLLVDGREVLGVSTTTERVPQNLWTKRTRYQAQWFEPVIRRYATRIDNLTSSDLQEVDMVRNENDRQLVMQAQVFSRQMLSGARRDGFRYSADLLAENAMLFLVADKYQFGSDYMRNAFQEKLKTVKAFSDTFQLESLLQVEQFTALLLNNKKEIAVTRVRPVQIRCVDCKGTGKVSTSYPNPNYDKNSPGASRIINHYQCRVCEGKKMLSLDSLEYTAEVTPRFRKELASLITLSDTPFCGLRLGSATGDILGISHYQGQRNLISRYRDGFSEYYIFKGNHRDSEVKATTLQFMFDKLVGVELVLAGNYTPEWLNERFLGRNSGTHAVVSSFASELDVPRDRSGKPLINPLSVTVTQIKDGRVFYQGSQVSFHHPAAIGAGRLRADDLE